MCVNFNMNGDCLRHPPPLFAGTRILRSALLLLPNADLIRANVSSRPPAVHLHRVKAAALVVAADGAHDLVTGFGPRHWHLHPPAYEVLSSLIRLMVERRDLVFVDEILEETSLNREGTKAADGRCVRAGAP